MDEVITRWDFPDQMYHLIAKSYTKDNNAKLYITLYNNLGVKITEFGLIAEQAARVLNGIFEYVNDYYCTGDAYIIETGFSAPLMENHSIYIQRICPLDDDGNCDYERLDIDTLFELSKYNIVNRKEVLILRCEMDQDTLFDFAMSVFYHHLKLSSLKFDEETYEWAGEYW